MRAVAAFAALAAGASAEPCTGGAAFCQQHLALGAAGELRVSWVSSAASAAPTVQWGTSAALPLPHAVAESQNDTYVLGDMCGAAERTVLGWEAPGWFHHAALTGVPPGARVWYRVGDAAQDAWGNVTGPVRAEGGATPSFAMFGDMGTYDYAPKKGELGAVDTQVAAALARVTPELAAVVHVGDLAYANDGPLSRWRYWSDEIRATADTVPWMVGCGNHECLYLEQPHHPVPWPAAYASAGGDGGACGVPYNARYWMPGDPALISDWQESRGGRRNNVFYSFDLGPVHFCMISSEHELGPQLEWLAQDLAGLDRAALPFVILGLHRPVYTSTQCTTAGETKALQDGLTPLLAAHRVQAVVAGHLHQYERTCAMAGGACTADAAANGTVYMTAGIAGLTASDDWCKDKPDWVVVQDRDHHGYARFDVVNTTHIHVTAVHTDDSLFDDFWLTA